MLDKIPLPKGKIFFAFLVIFIVGIITYSNCLHNYFVLDDVHYIVSNPALQLSSSLTYAFNKDNLFNLNGQYRPLVYIYFYFLHTFYSENPYNYHLMQLGIHLINTFLLYQLFKRFFNNTLSLILSLIFLAHPLQVESVSYIAAADNPLFFFFGIIALLLSLPDRLNWLRLTSISILLLIALLVKETAIIIFILIALYRILFRYKQKLAILISLTIPAVLYAFIRFGLTGSIITNTENPLYVSGQPLETRLLNLPAILFYYLKNFVYPSHFQYQPLWIIKHIDYAHFYIPLLFDSIFIFVLTIIGFVMVFKRRANGSVYIFFFAWLIIGLLFHSQIFPLDVTLANRWMYLPIIGFLGCIGAALQSLKIQSAEIKFTGAAIAVFIIFILVNQTIQTNTDWRSEQTIIIRELNTNDITAQEKIFDNQSISSPGDN